MTINEMKLCIAHLEAQGWTKIASVMHDGGDTGKFGLLFTREGAEFWLNKNTAFLAYSR
jgi:hypothetical protein